MVENALACLKKNLTSAESSYSKALLAYVFTLAGDTEIRHQLLTTLDEQAEKTGRRDYFIQYNLCSGGCCFASLVSRLPFPMPHSEY